MRINYEIADIEAFIAVAERLSYATAAEDLNISASSLSRRVHKLEAALNRRLFDRTTREVHLTIAGKQLFARARDLIETMAEIQLTMKGEQVSRPPTLVFACVPSVMRRRIPSAIHRFLQRHPKARLRLLDLPSNEVLEAILQRDAEFGISYVGQDDPGLEFMTLEIEEYVLAVKKEHPFARRTEIRWAELVGQKLISPWKESGVRVLMDQALAKAGMAVQWTYEVRHSTTALILVESGLGITAVPRSLALDRNSPDVATINLVEPSVQRAISLVKVQGRSLRPVAREMWDILRP
jgi:DNA-binding transcriptional LysR family regulator